MALRASGREVIRASIDGFHNSRAIRHRHGRGSVKGYYDDSFDINAVLSCVLFPLGPGGDRKYKVAQFDFRTDSAVDCAWELASDDAVLIFEGVLLLRSAFFPHWDFSVFVDTSAAVAIERAILRDGDLFGTEAKTRAAYEGRYIPGQQLYMVLEGPLEKANAVWKNDDVLHPTLVVNRPTC